MAYAATPAATPGADVPAPAEQGKAPPVIDSHGGKLTPVTGYMIEPVANVLVLVALAALLARSLWGGRKAPPLRRATARAAPGLLLALATAWVLVSSLGAPDFPQLAIYDHTQRVWRTCLLAVVGLGLISDLFAVGDLIQRRPAWALAAAAGTLISLIVGVLLTPAVMTDQAILWQPAAMLIGVLLAVPTLWLRRRVSDGRFAVIINLPVVAVLAMWTVLWPSESANLLLWLAIGLFTPLVVATQLSSSAERPNEGKPTNGSGWFWVWFWRWLFVVAGLSEFVG